MKKEIIWGTCWLNESISEIVEFMSLSVQSLSKLNYKVVSVIFDAKFEERNKEHKVIEKNIDNVIIIKNKVNIFPNKNYGIALITKKAMQLNIPYIAIVDSDWGIDRNLEFIKNLLTPLEKTKADIIIPNIGDAAGRSNILIGKTVINLFYPEYKDKIITPFPGSLIASTSKLYKIVNNENYHYDWGGEWDIISLAIKNKMKIESVLVDVKGIRHRNNQSKILDSFQIWRAVLSNEDIINRFSNLINSNIKVTNSNELTKLLFLKDYNIPKMLKIIKNNSTPTQKQLLYMILYPIAYINGELRKIPIIENNNIPYDKEELELLQELAIWCCKKMFIGKDIKKIYEKSKTVKCKYFSEWDFNKQTNAILDFEVI